MLRGRWRSGEEEGKVGKVHKKEWGGVGETGGGQ